MSYEPYIAVDRSFAAEILTALTEDGGTPFGSRLLGEPIDKFDFGTPGS